MPLEADEIHDATLALLLADGLGPVTWRKLREKFGSDELAASASVAELMTIPGIGRQSAEALRRAIDQTDLQRQRELMQQHHVRMILIDDQQYPPLLASIDSAPPALWIRGELDTADNLSVAIVGSRRCTAYGREQAGRFSAILAQSGLTIVSGGALGVDGEAHRAALRANGRTIAVLGCGIDINYPPQHEALFDQIVDAGSAVISEFPMGIAPRAENFPRRNRIISGLALGVLVIEAAKRSGALITARKAADEHGREVMALPGRVDSVASAGCLQAIREGWAALVIDHLDVLEQLDSASNLIQGATDRVQQLQNSDAAGLFSNADDSDANGTRRSMLEQNLSETQQKILESLREADSSLAREQIAASTKLALQTVLADLTMLEIRGLIRKDVRGLVHITRKSTAREPSK